jgi:hypothetical protein
MRLGIRTVLTLGGSVRSDLYFRSVRVLPIRLPFAIVTKKQSWSRARTLTNFIAVLSCATSWL